MNPLDDRAVLWAKTDKVGSAGGASLVARHKLDGEGGVLDIHDHAPSFGIDRDGAPIDAAARGQCVGHRSQGGVEAFEAAVREAKLASIMNAYNELDGVPCGSSK